MRIAQIATLSTPVRETNSGSVESLVWLMARELTRLGHEVTVFGAGDSETYGEFVKTLPGPYGSPRAPDDWQMCEWINLCRAVEQSGRFDVMHSHAYLWGMPLQPVALAPMLHTLHVSPFSDQARLWGMYPEAWVTAISSYQWSGFPQFHPAAVIYHGVDPAQFTFRDEPEDYVCYLGRFTSGKSPWHAIKTARSLGIRLLLAGPRNDYYRAKIEPLVDGQSVEYVGSVSGAERDRLLGGARALLYPLQAPEPFGLVMVEAMMCGTPVVSTRLGAAPEIVEDGITGYCADTVDDLARAALMAMSLARYPIGERALLRFSAERMAREYARVYERLAQVTG